MAQCSAGQSKKTYHTLRPHHNGNKNIRNAGICWSEPQNPCIGSTSGISAFPKAFGHSLGFHGGSRSGRYTNSWWPMHFRNPADGIWRYRCLNSRGEQLTFPTLRCERFRHVLLRGVSGYRSQGAQSATDLCRKKKTATEKKQLFWPRKDLLRERCTVSACTHFYEHPALQASVHTFADMCIHRCMHTNKQTSKRTAMYTDLTLPSDLICFGCLPAEQSSQDWPCSSALMQNTSPIFRIFFRISTLARQFRCLYFICKCLLPRHVVKSLFFFHVSSPVSDPHWWGPTCRNSMCPACRQVLILCYSGNVHSYLYRENIIHLFASHAVKRDRKKWRSRQQHVARTKRRCQPSHIWAIGYCAAYTRRMEFWCPSVHPARPGRAYSVGSWWQLSLSPPISNSAVPTSSPLSYSACVSSTQMRALATHSIWLKI